MPRNREKHVLPSHLKQVTVIWRDAFINPDKEGTKEELLKYVTKDCIRYTSGFLLGKTKEFVVVGFTFDSFHKKPVFQGVHAIPHGMVVKICYSTWKSSPRSCRPSVSPPASSSPSDYSYGPIATPPSRLDESDQNNTFLMDVTHP